MGAWRGYLLRPWAKPLVTAFVLSPLAYLIHAALFDERLLGPNPAEALIRDTGELALRYLCVTLAITPLRVISGWPEWARLRRMIGLIVFSYAVCHLLCYSWFDMGFDWGDIALDLGKRPFILVGMLTLVLLSLLAATSFSGAIRWMGARHWQRLHRGVYLAALLALLHFYWKRSGKHHFDEVWVYGAVIALLLGWRLWRRFKPMIVGH